MARIRTIKPMLWESEQLAQVSMSASLVFIGLISHADDEGKQKVTAQLLRGKLFGHRDDVSTVDVAGWMTELHDARLIDLYGPPGGPVRYCRLPTWNDHQKINRKSKSDHPDPSSQYPILPREKTAREQAIHDALSDSSVSAHDRKGREGKGEERACADPTDPVNIAATMLANAVASHNQKHDKACNSDESWWADSLRMFVSARANFPTAELVTAAIDFSGRLESGLDLRPGNEWSRYVYKLRYLVGDAKRAESTMEQQASTRTGDALHSRAAILASYGVAVVDDEPVAS